MSSPALSAGIVVVYSAQEEWHYLLLRAYQYWDFPKGMVERGETPFAAAQRETREETTLENLLFRWGDIYFQTDPYNHGRKIARYYLAESLSSNVALPISEELGHPEHDEYRWINFAGAQKLVEPRVTDVLKWARSVLQEGSPATG